MDRRQSKKRFASTSRSSSPHTKQRRRVVSSLLNSSRSSDEQDHDSGLETFISDSGGGSSDDTFDLSQELPFVLRTDEKLLVDSPIIKDMEKMTVISRTGKSPKKVSFALSPCSSKVLQISKGKQFENFVNGRSLIKVESHDSNSRDHKAENRNDKEFRVRRCFMIEQQFDSTLDQRDHDKENWPGYQRSPLMFEQHSEIEEDMRSILLAWLMEVCKAYCLRRRTYHMALDYVDRFLTLTENLPKGLLQLVGVASLSLASKVEEIFPPELKEMAYVTAEAHSRQEIKSMEKIIFAALGTAFMPITPSDCVGTYLKMAGLTGYTGSPSAEPTENTKIARENQLPFRLFSKICRVVDLALLDAQSLQFTYRQIAASAIFLVDRSILSSKNMTGAFNVAQHRDCIEWMRRYAVAESKLREIIDSAPCEDPRHHHRRTAWPHLQLYNFTLEDFMAIMEAKKAEASHTSRQSEENSDGNSLVEDMIDRLFDDEEALMFSCKNTSTSKFSPTKSSMSSLFPESMFFTPPDSRRQSSCSSLDSRGSSSHGSG